MTSFLVSAVLSAASAMPVAASAWWDHRSASECADGGQNLSGTLVPVKVSSEVFNTSANYSSAYCPIRSDSEHMKEQITATAVYGYYNGTQKIGASVCNETFDGSAGRCSSIVWAPSTAGYFNIHPAVTDSFGNPVFPQNRIQDTGYFLISFSAAGGKGYSFVSGYTISG